MDVDKIRELIELMKANDLNEVRIVDGESRLLLKRGAEVHQVMSMPMASAPTMAAAPAAAPAAAAPAAAESDDANLQKITSPMVGTFYAASSPDAQPFVRVGDRVTPDKVVCIIEAMKVMNEIKAEVSGVVARVNVQNGQAVEFSQPLFFVRPD